MTDINKQIESAEKIVENKGKCTTKGNYVMCEDCPLSLDEHDPCDEALFFEAKVENCKNWLSQNKPQAKMTKEELKIGQQVTFYSRVTNSEKTGKIIDFDIYTKNPVINVGKFFLRNMSGESISNLCPSFDEIKFVNGLQFVHESNNSQTTSIDTIEEEGEQSNNSQTKPDFEPHTEWMRLDKILDNIESLEKQKNVIEERIVESENQLQCKLNDKLLCEYVASDALFNITTEGSRLENIDIVIDFIDSLLKVEKV